MKLPRLSLLLTVLGLTACTGLLPDLVGKPPALYELRAPEASALPSGPQLKAQLLVDVPMSSAGIDTPRVALIGRDGALAYYKDVSWTDRAPVMFQTLIVSSFDHSGRLPAVGRENVGLRADYLLKTDLADFQADYRAGGAPVVRVALNAKLVEMPRRLIVSGHVASAEVKAEGESMAAVQQAFQQASTKALAELVGWTLAEMKPGQKNPGLHSTYRSRED